MCCLKCCFNAGTVGAFSTDMRLSQTGKQKKELDAFNVSESCSSHCLPCMIVPFEIYIKNA